MSRSIAQSYRQHRCLAIARASAADFLGRYPYEFGWKYGSTAGSRYILTTV
jgi:hypothetical protein